MTSIVKEQSNIFFQFGSRVISFIVGLSAFYTIKLVFLIPFNLMITPDNIEKMKDYGVFLIILSIYLAVNYTKKLNKNKNKKSRIIRRVMTIIIGFICMVVSTAFITISKSISYASRPITPMPIITPQSNELIYNKSVLSGVVVSSIAAQKVIRPPFDLARYPKLFQDQPCPI